MIKKRYVAGALMVILLICISVATLIFPPGSYYVPARGRLELIKVTFNENPEGKPISITVLLENSGKATVNLTSLRMGRELMNTDPELPLIIEPRDSVNITIMYEWRYNSCFGPDVEYTINGHHIGQGWAVDTWTKPLFRWTVLREKSVFFVGDKVNFPVHLEYKNCSRGHGRSLKEVVGRVTALVDVQNPRGEVERITIFPESPHGSGATGDDFVYSFDEAGEWVLNFSAESDNYGSLANYSMPIKVLDQGFNITVRAFNKESCFIREFPYTLLNINHSYMEKFTWFYEGCKVWVYGNNTVDFQITVNWQKMPQLEGDLMVEVTDPVATKTKYYIESVQMNGSNGAEPISWAFSITKVGEWLFDFKLGAGDTVSHQPVTIYANRTEISLSVETDKESYGAGEEVLMTINETWINVIREGPWGITYLIEIDIPSIDTGTGEIDALPRRKTIWPGIGTSMSRGFGGYRVSYKGSIGSFAAPGVYKLTAKLLANKRVLATATTEFIVEE